MKSKKIVCTLTVIFIAMLYLLALPSISKKDSEKKALAENENKVWTYLSQTIILHH